MTGQVAAAATPGVLDRLRAGGLPLAEVTALVAELEGAAPQARTVTYGVSANVTVDLFEPFLRRQALLDGHRAVVRMGNYDDHLGNARRFAEARVDVLIALSLFDNLLPSLETRAPAMGAEELDALRRRAREQTRLLLEEARGIARIYLCTFHRLAAPAASGVHGRLDEILGTFDADLRELVAANPNARLLQLPEVVARVGWERAFDPRFYYRYRAPYSTAFFEELARQVSLAGRGAGAHYLKALVLDADNTLWGGIVGEDLDKIRLSPHDYPGNVYWQAQQAFLALRGQGVLLCLNSKNNPGDVEAALAGHPHAVLRPEHFAASQVNWEDKPANLRRLAKTLNIGLDAMVFLDDSPFECEAVRGQLPMVRTFQVPERIHEYPALIEQLRELFVAGGVSAESAAKSEQYRIRAEAEEARSRFASQEEYLASLGLKVEVRLGERAAIPRISELTQKSNQFNLTTRRYTPGELQALMEASDAEVFSVHVRDRFGDSGLTGIVILRYGSGVVDVDSFLLSCRVIGRGVEFALWSCLLSRAAGRGARTLRAQYLPTAKNEQVRDFYDRLGLSLSSEEDGARRYAATLDALRLPPTPHIEVSSAF